MTAINEKTVAQLKKEEAVLVLVDFQERLMPAMKSTEELSQTVVKLVKGVRVLQIPILVTQQYTKGLGPTAEEIAKALTEELFDGFTPAADYAPIEKTSFSALKEPAFVEALKACGRRSVILAGIEAHICVQQTALDLLAAGYEVFVVSDCIASRSNNDKKYSQRRMGDAGACGTTYESVLYELLGGAKEPGFKQISAIVK